MKMNDDLKILFLFFSGILVAFVTGIAIGRLESIPTQEKYEAMLSNAGLRIEELEHELSKERGLYQ